VDHWRSPLDLYCERLGPGFWAEPLNAVSNAAFVLAAAYGFVLWRRAGAADRPALGLVLVTLTVGIGSFLFHTFAERWSLYADVIPITAFIYAYLLLALRPFVGLGLWPALAVTAGFSAFNLAFGPALRAPSGQARSRASTGRRATSRRRWRSLPSARGCLRRAQGRGPAAPCFSAPPCSSSR
jgi:hypothetical protein